MFTSRLIRAALAAAIISTVSGLGATARDSGGGGGGENVSARIKVEKKVKVPKPGKLKDVGGRKKAGPQEWTLRDRNGKITTKVSRSRITGRYTLSQYGRDPRNGRNVPVRVRTFSEGKWRKMTSYDGQSTTITVGRGSRARTYSVAGNATPPPRG